MLSFLGKLGINSWLEVLSLAGLCYVLIRRFVLRKSPVPSSAFQKVPRELLQTCVNLLRKQEKRTYDMYTVPEDIWQALSRDKSDEVWLKKLLCDICQHMGMDGSFIRLVIQDTPGTDRAGEISTDLAFTTIRLEMKPHYTLEAIVAVLAHEATHLHLYYKGIRLKDAWENEILTDTATIYCGFGEYIYKGYAVMQGEFDLFYHKVGYIRQEDVKYILSLLNGD